MAEAEPTGLEKRNVVRVCYKIIAYIAAWIVAFLATGPGLWPLAYLFPLGLIAVFSRHLANDGGWGIFIGCYIAYVVQAYFYFRSKTSIQMIFFYAILVLMLIANVAGCREMVHSH